MFDRDVQMSDDKMMELLREADLESHGYKKEIITQRVVIPEMVNPSTRNVTNFSRQSSVLG